MTDYPNARCTRCGNVWLYRGKYADKPEKIFCPKCRQKEPELKYGEFTEPILTASEAVSVTEPVSDAMEYLFTPQAYEPPAELIDIVKAKEPRPEEPALEPEGEAPPEAKMAQGIGTFVQFIGARLNLAFGTKDFEVDSVSANILADALAQELAESGGDNPLLASAYTRRFTILVMIGMLFGIPIMIHVVPRVLEWIAKYRAGKTQVTVLDLDKTMQGVEEELKAAEQEAPDADTLKPMSIPPAPIKGLSIEDVLKGR